MIEHVRDVRNQRTLVYMDGHLHAIVYDVDLVTAWPGLIPYRYVAVPQPTVETALSSDKVGTEDS